MTTKTVFREVLWLVATAGLTILFIIILFSSGTADDNILGMLFGDTSLDINFHDNNFVFGFWWGFILTFTTIAFLLYTIKEGAKQYSRVFPNCILIVDSLLVIVQTAILINTINQMLVSWTAYPPLTTLITFQDNPFLRNFIWTLYSILTVASIIFVFVSYKTVKTISKNKNT